MMHRQSPIPIRQTPWLRVSREILAELWAGNTGHLPGVQRPDWASELIGACSDTKGHLSLPCSLREQANNIGIFLTSQSFDVVPTLFLKLYTILLSEFNGQLHDVAGLMELETSKPPRLTAVWANCWAKHALGILVQHHPRYLFADELGTDWALYQADKQSLVVYQQNATRREITIIDTDWLCSNSSCRDASRVKLSGVPVVVVPPLAEYLNETMTYYRAFLELVLADPCKIRMFEGEHYSGIDLSIRGGSQSKQWYPRR